MQSEPTSPPSSSKSTPSNDAPKDNSEKSPVIQSENKLQLVKNSIIDKCFDEFFTNKKDREGLVDFLIEKKIQEDDKIADETREKRREDVKKDENLDGFRYRDPRFHNRPHVVGEPTPGHEVEGRDPSLLYKLMNERLFHRDPKTIIKPDNETVKKLIEKQPRSIKS